MNTLTSLSSRSGTRAARFLALSALVGASLVGCASSNPDVVPRSQAQSLQSVRFGQVVSVRAVTVDGTQSGLGAVAGAVAGGVAGSSVGGKREGLAVGVIGAVLGGALGNAIERSATKEGALEFVLQLDDGSRHVLVQAQGAQDIQVGDRVRLVGSGSSVRLAR